MITLDKVCFTPARATNSVLESKEPDHQSGFFTSGFWCTVITLDVESLTPARVTNSVLEQLKSRPHQSVFLRLDFGVQ